MRKIIKWSEFLADSKTRKSMIYRPGLECVYDEGALPESIEGASEGSILHLQKHISASEVPGTAGDWIVLGGGGTMGMLPIVHTEGEEKVGGVQLSLAPGNYTILDRQLQSGEALVVDLDQVEEGLAGEFLLEFFSKGQGNTLSFSQAVEFPVPLTLSANSRYVVTIVNNIATWCKITVPDYFYVRDLSEEGGSINMTGESTTGTLSFSVSYSTDNKKTWKDVVVSTAGNTVIEDVEPGATVYFKGENSNILGLRIRPQYDYAAGGDITTLINPEGCVMDPEKNIFKDMFHDDAFLINAENLILPALELPEDAYYDMFEGCGNMELPPSELPALTIGEEAYWSMFMGCAALTTIPNIKAVEAGYESLGWMFSDCCALGDLSEKQICLANYPELCCDNMFSYSGVTKAPQMNISEADGDEAFFSMFYDCERLEDISKINIDCPSTGYGTFSFMFEECKILDSVLDMSSITIFKSASCAGMYRDCTAIQDASGVNFTPGAELITYYPEYKPHDGVFEAMFLGCSELVEGPAMPFGYLTEYCCKDMFKNCTNLQSLSISATEISATDCLKDWLSGASTLGYLHNLGGKDLPYGASGLPRNWAEIRDPESAEYANSVVISYKNLDEEDLGPQLIAIGASRQTYTAQDFGEDYTALAPTSQELCGSIAGKEIRYVFWYEQVLVSYTVDYMYNGSELAPTKTVTDKHRRDVVTELPKVLARYICLNPDEYEGYRLTEIETSMIFYYEPEEQD